MDMNDFLGMDVIDNQGKNIGKIDSVEFDKFLGQINKIIIKLNKGFFSREKDSLDYSTIENIKDVVLLNVQIDMDKE